LYKLQKFQDNANLNLNNSVAINNFVNAARQVRADLKSKYQGVFVDPAFTDAWERDDKANQ